MFKTVRKNAFRKSSKACLEYRAKCLVPNVTIFVKLPPNSGHLLITDEFIKTRTGSLF